MGWSFYHATHYNEKGQVDRKKECDAYFIERSNRGHYKIEKSVMVGTTYYAAVRNLVKWAGDDGKGKSVYEPIPEEDQEVWAMVILTNVRNRDYYNFGYKEMSENMGPFECSCPKSMLDLLTETKDKDALVWRASCRENAAKKNELSRLPLGARLRVVNRDMDYSLIKCIPAGRKRAMWVDWNKRAYLTLGRIQALGYQIIG